jgi:hypothetical protein
MVTDSQIEAFLCDVPSTICFGRLVFKHTGDLNFPESLRTVKEINTPTGKTLQISLEV